MAAACRLTVGSVLISGANRGIGLEFVRQLTKLTEPPKHIFATCRNPGRAQTLKELAQENKNIHIHKLDLLDFESYPTVVKWVEDVLGPDLGLNILINNAATFHIEGLDAVSRNLMLLDYETNAVAPLLLTRAFLPLLKKAAAASDATAPISCSRAAVINMGSKMGSITENTDDACYPYRTSKAALHQITKSLAYDLKPFGILVTALHPGSVKTDMSGPQALMEPETSVSSLIRLMERLDEQQAGCLLNFDGNLIPW